MPYTFPPRSHEVVDWVFLLSGKQTAYGTPAVGNTLVDRVRGVGVSPAEIQRTLQSDANVVGREHPTTRRELARDVRMTRTFQLSSELAGWALAFALGKSTPDAGPPITHTSTFLAPLTEGFQVPVFSAYEELWEETAVKRMFHDLAIASLTISGRRRELCTLQVSLVGSGAHTAADIAIPATDLTEHLLHGGDTLFEYGARAGKADATDRLLEWSVTIEPALDEDGGYMFSSGIYRGKMWQGSVRRASASIVVWADIGSTDIYDDWLSDAAREMSITITGAVIGAGPAVHSVELLFPGFMPSAAAIGEQDGKMLYRLAVNPEDLIVDGLGTPDDIFQSVVINETAAYLQAPA
jgi:hypothetical protein